MNKIKLIPIVLLVMLFALPSLTLAQQPTQTPEKSELDVATLKQLKGKVFELKYREPRNIFGVITPLGSGYKGALIMLNDDLHIITVRDFPENVAAIEEAIKRLDVPQAARPQINIETQVS